VGLLEVFCQWDYKIDDTEEIFKNKLEHVGRVMINKQVHCG